MGKGADRMNPKDRQYDSAFYTIGTFFTMEQHALKNVNNCLNINIYSYLETSGGQSYHLYLNIVYFFNASADQTSVAA